VLLPQRKLSVRTSTCPSLARAAQAARLGPESAHPKLTRCLQATRNRGEAVGLNHSYHHLPNPMPQLPRSAASASLARSASSSKNSLDWPMKSPSLVKPLTAAIAPPSWSEVGRMIETAGNFRLRNGHGSGMIRLVWKSSPPSGATLRFGNTN